MSESRCFCGQVFSPSDTYCSRCGKVVPSCSYVGCHMCSGKGTMMVNGSQQFSGRGEETVIERCIYCSGTGRVAI